MHSIVGKTVVFWGQKAWREDDNEEVPISGLFTVEERIPYEPSCYQWEAGFMLYDGNRAYFMGDYTFWEAVNPSSIGREVVMEREMEFHADEF